MGSVSWTKTMWCCSASEEEIYARLAKIVTFYESDQNTVFRLKADMLSVLKYVSMKKNEKKIKVP